MEHNIRRKAPFVSEDRKKELFVFQKENNLEFNDVSLLNNAFVHSSFANEARSNNVVDNERLEFLGDSVLSVVISEWLYENLNGDEGECTRVRSLVVSEDALFDVAIRLKLDKYLIIGHGEELSGGRLKKAILADCTEAIFAAIYLDQGFEAAKNFILKNLMGIIDKVLENRYRKDYKTILQEHIQKSYKKVPTYTLIEAVGPEHDQIFYYTVTFQDKTYGPAPGHNKKDAEQNVAKLALEKIGYEF